MDEEIRCMPTSKENIPLLFSEIDTINIYQISKDI